jgi:hypothetical protein
MAENYINSVKIFGYTGNLTGTVQCIPGASFLHGVYNAANNAAASVKVDSYSIYISAGRVEFPVPVSFQCFSGGLPYTLIYS